MWPPPQGQLLQGPWEETGAGGSSLGPTKHGLTWSSRTGSLLVPHTLNCPLVEPWRLGRQLRTQHGCSQQEAETPPQGRSSRPHFLGLEAKGREGVQERTGLETGREVPPPEGSACGLRD